VESGSLPPHSPSRARGRNIAAAVALVIMRIIVVPSLSRRRCFLATRRESSDDSPMRSIYVVTGGTLVHVSPHFSLCAPAYGRVGLELCTQLSQGIAERHWQEALGVYLVRTKMAGPSPEATTAHLRELGISSSLETNDDLRRLLDAITAKVETAAIVMAAAICDFEPVELIASGDAGPSTVTEFGKHRERLHHVDTLTLKLRAAAKLIDGLKARRPEILLVTFKTTAGAAEAEQLFQALENLRRSRSDLVFANDVRVGRNLVVTPEGDKLSGADRQATLRILADALLDRLAI
jgi:hypothetical protein